MSVHAAVADPSVMDEMGVATARSRTWRTLRGDPWFWIGLGGVTLVVVIAILAPLLSPHPPDKTYPDVGLTARGDPLGPSQQFPLGTDVNARDYLSRLLYGARTSLAVALGANIIATIVGVVVAASAGFLGTPRVRLSMLGHGVVVPVPVENVLMRMTDAVIAFPVPLLAIALVSVTGPSLVVVVGVIAIVLWTGVARVVYARVLVLRDADFVVAARAVGAGELRILTRHVMPHLASIVIVYGTIGLASAVLLEATLSFLGVGVPVPGSSWGSEIAQGIGYYATDPRLVLLPGVALAATVLVFTLLGDALRDAFDPYHER